MRLRTDSRRYGNIDSLKDEEVFESNLAVLQLSLCVAKKAPMIIGSRLAVGSAATMPQRK